MRMTLCRPVSRVRVLLVKYVVCVIYTFSLVFFIGLSALAVGLLVRGAGGLFFIVPGFNVLALYDFGEGLERYLALLPCISLTMLTLSTFAFQLSCWNVKPAAATLGLSADFAQRDLTLPAELADEERGRATLAICSEVLEHVDVPDVLLRHAAEYLAPGSRLVITVPSGPRSRCAPLEIWTPERNAHGRSCRGRFRNA